MSSLINEKAYWKMAGACAECGHCVGACPSLQSAGMTLGAIAKRFLEHDASSDDIVEVQTAIWQDAQLTQAVRGCYFCTACEQVCFANNDVGELICAAREDYQRLNLIPREAWSSVLVDQEWDIFTAYRAIYGIGYPDLTRHIDSDWGAAATDCEVAFFPGCSLAAYGPELTREVFACVEELGGKTTMIDHCCGSPLKSAGFFERAVALVDKIAIEIEASGAKHLVCVCPGCANNMRPALAARGLDIETVTLPVFLVARGYSPKRDLSDLTIRLSKSCQDRDSRCLDATRELLGVGPDAPAVFTGCCGAGGAVSAFAYAQQGEQIKRKLDQFEDGETVVSMCPTCTYTYAFDLMATPRNISNKNYLELVFDNQFDWQTASERLNGMWTGEYGPWLAQVFA